MTERKNPVAVYGARLEARRRPYERHRNTRCAPHRDHVKVALFAQAHAREEAGEHFGKLVLSIG